MNRKLFWYGILFLFIALCSGLWLFGAATQAHYRHHGAALLPDAIVTPGKVRTSVASEVCSETTKQFRNTTEAMKRSVYAAYGVDKHKVLASDGWHGIAKPPLYEIDHLISLELGGADDVANLWPQPMYEHPGAKEKDKLENELHRKVCAGEITLAEAQAGIATDWYDLYLKMEKEKQ